MLALSPSHSPGVRADVNAPHAGLRSVSAARSVP